jgi:uncharacterized repeat protein (TIGR02543 family)
MKNKFIAALVASVFLLTASASLVYAENAIKAPSNIKAGSTFTIHAIGDNMYSNGNYDGEIKYVPYSIDIECINNNDSDYLYYDEFGNLPYDLNTKIRPPGKYRITVDFNIKEFETPDHNQDGIADYSLWQDIEDITLTKTINVIGKVKFNANKGKITGTKTKWLTFGKKYGKLPKATRSGKKFYGWYTKKSGGKRITSATKYKTAKATLTLYARWTKSNKKKSGSGGVGSYVASRYSDVFHYTWCRYVKQIKSYNIVYYSTRNQATNDGKRPCKVCRP